jgi:hypothetical protein
MIRSSLPKVYQGVYQDLPLFAPTFAYHRETRMLIEFYGAPGEIRTPGLLVRSQTLYPAELRAHSCKFSNHNTLRPHLREEEMQPFSYIGYKNSGWSNPF